MERCGADLESKADQQHAQGDEWESFHSVFSERHGKVGELQGARPEVEQGQAVQTNTGSNRTDDEVLHARLGTFFAFLHERDQDIGREGSQFQADEEHEQILSQGHHGHAKTRRDEQDVKVDLASVVVQTAQTSVGSAGRWNTIHRGCAGQRKCTEENQLKHSAELIDLKHRGAARCDDLCRVHATDEGDHREAKCDGEKHRSEEARQARVAVKFATLTAEEPRNANLRERNTELGVAHVRDDHQRKQTDNEHEFGGECEHKAFSKRFDSVHIRHLPKSESEAIQRTPPSIRSSCPTQSMA